jgi:imidazolonepropionase-like amidohydrolase
LLTPTSAVAVTLGLSAKKDAEKSPGTRGKMMALLRAKLIAAQEYLAARNKDGKTGKGDTNDGEKKEVEKGRDLGLDVLVRVLQREVPLLVTAHKAQDIANALRLADEFKVRLILDGASEATLLSDKILAAGVPVIIHPSMMRAHGETENASFQSAAKLKQAGIPIALQSGYESYVPKTRVVLFEAAIAAAYGLTFEEALATITIDAARILGIDERVGSLAVDKDGDLALFDGDPFEYTTHCVTTIIEGKVVSSTPR